MILKKIHVEQSRFHDPGWRQLPTKSDKCYQNCERCTKKQPKHEQACMMNDVGFKDMPNGPMS